MKNLCHLCNIVNSENFLFSEKYFHVCIGPFSEKWPGHLMLVYKEHVEEQSDVELEKIAEVFQRIVMVEKVMRDVLRPARINFAKFGNVASHLHWHIIPRFVGEIYTDKSPWELLATDELYKLPSRRPVNNIEMLMQSLKESLEIQ